MSPAHVLEPTYYTLKTRLMAGEWPFGFRLEAARLAGMLGVSVTPVRDSLYRLAGEQMVDFVPGEGFHVRRIDETELRDLMELNLILLLAAIAASSSIVIAHTVANDNHAQRTAALFLELASRSANSALITTIGTLNDRLHLVRSFDPIIFPTADAEFFALEEAIRAPAGSETLRQLLLRYHHLRAREAATYVRLLANR